VSGPVGAQVFTLESAEQPYRVLIEQMQEGAVTLSEEGVILYCNLRFSQMLRVPHEKMITSPVQSFVVPEQAERLDLLLGKGARESARAEMTLRAGDGTLLPTYITVSPLPVEVEGCLCMVVTDLTEQESMRRNHAEIEQLNERLRRSMRETHHRVKNNLQIIAAMVDMQVMNDGTTIPVQEMSRLGAHVKTLAVVHDLLTAESGEDEQAQTVSSRAVLATLLPLLEQTAGGRHIQAHLEDALLSSRQATSLALITNEIIANALKHGEGEVGVTFRIHDNTATLEVCDDGPGFPLDFNPKQLATTGISLVENLSRWDLEGKVRYENRLEGGAKVVLNVPLTRDPEIG